MAKKLLFFILMGLSGAVCHAQLTGWGPIIDGDYIDSATITFQPGQPLFDTTNGGYYRLAVDTPGCQLWRVDTTTKPFFSLNNPAGNYATMTDTSQPYPVGANDYFTVTIPHPSFNVIIDFDHKYQTASGMDGGIVEYKYDDTTWMNVIGDCWVDSNWGMPGIHTGSFYRDTDTLADGQPAFSGESSGWVHSRLQFFQGLPIKTTGIVCPMHFDTLVIRFRFQSDTTADTLDGWMIDNIALEYDYFGGSVAELPNGKSLAIYPNPVTDGILHFPALLNQEGYRLSIINSSGQLVREQSYNTHADVSQLATGIYFYRVQNGTEYYSGRFIIQ